MKYLRAFLCLILVFAMTVTIFGANISASATAQQEIVQPEATTVESVSFWSGEASDGFAGGDGTKENPYIIETADQLYRALSFVTGTTQGVHSSESVEVAGGYQSDKILRQSSTTDYVPVYTPYYYKVADGVEAFYLNDIKDNETLEGIKAFVAGSAKKEWKPEKAFVGNLDGNGVTIYGMYSPNGKGFVGKLDGSANVKNFNFDACYVSGSGNAAIVTTTLGSYNNDTTVISVANISVRNSYIATTRNITLTQRTDNDYYQYNPGAAGIISTTSTCENLTITNCLYDGMTCERKIGSSSEATVDMIGGIISGGFSMNNVTVVGSVAFGAPITDEVAVSGKEVFYNRYDVNLGYPVHFYDCYSDLQTVLPTMYPGKYDKLLDIKCVNSQQEYAIQDMPGLNWRDSWQLVKVGDRIIPIPQNNADAEQNMYSYAEQITAQNNNGGAYNIFGGAYYYGTYGMYHTLSGSGTKEDPYLIHNAFELARAIASGGKNVYNQLYYKLVCDIDASEAKWITQDSIVKSASTKYEYVPFGGVLDGDGYTITGLFTGDDQAVGLVPVLAKDGVVKNVHIRDGIFISGDSYAGAIAGETQDGSSIIGCSAEKCVVESEKANSYIAGGADGKVKDSYYVSDTTVYYNAQGEKANIDLEDSDLWYKGGKEGSVPRLKSFAVTQDFVDVDGDGLAEGYTARDITALQNKLLQKESYKYVYGDVNRSGEINLADLAALQMKIVGSYDETANDFWYNLRNREVNIYYGENDNYDAARRLEIYLESQLPGVDIKKVVSADKTVSGTDSDKTAVYVHENDLTGTPEGSLEIIVGNIETYSAYAQNTLGINDYSINYNDENSVLWLNGGSFTGVEQAVLDFINNSAEKTGSVYTVENATLAPEKRAKTVMVDTNYDGQADTEKALYYAWGDEFNSENGEILIDTWNHARMRTETEVGKAGNYNNVETVNENELKKLYLIKDGKLTITRGVKASHATAETDKLNYVRLYEQEGKTALNDEIDDEDIIANPGLIKTNHSFLYKQGYAEMYGRLPSDGHTFASWWMLGHGSMNNFAMGESLYGKVYKLNNTGEYAYDGTSSWPISTDPKTYRYQVPTNYFEIDVWELMQNNGIAATHFQQNKLTGFYDYRLYLNVHKFYSVGARNQSTVNVIDWNNPGTPRAVMQKDWFGSKDYYFSTSARYHDFTDGTTTRFTYSNYGFLNLNRGVSANYVESLQKQLTAPRRYGFYWDTNGVDKFNLTLYIYDANGDGVEDDNMILGTSDMTYNTDSGKNPQDYDCVNDAEVANQYMYFLFDNILYSSNPKHSSSKTDDAAMHNDMLVNNGTSANPDKIDLEIDYLRVYQFDGRRDIVTDMTESFNNGNHFGY